MYQLVEWSATFVECFVILCTIVSILGKRQTRVPYHLALILATAVLAGLIIVMNAALPFSFLTPIVAMCFVSLVLSKILSGGSLLTRSVACIMTYFVILTVDYILFALLALCLGWSEAAFSIIMAPGNVRTGFLFLDKAADVGLFLCVRSLLPKVRNFKRAHQIVLFSICFVSYVTIQYLFSTYIDSNIGALHTVSLISWLYILSFFVIMLITFILVARAEQEHQTHMLLEKTNQLLAENYQQLHLYQQDYAKKLHDFKHHLSALKGLEALERHEEALIYIDALLSTAYQESALCHSGSDIIDAIINRKAVEAAHRGIQFSFVANFRVPANISSVDICGVLANQIDNAFEACMQISSSNSRKVWVAIKQVENFAFFRVENTVAHDPFEHNASLRTTKNDPLGQHGFGLKNIHDIAEKYSGFLSNEYKNGRFISIVSLCYEPLST